MNKSRGFKVGDTVVSGNHAGTIKGISSVGGKIAHLRVVLVDGKTIMHFKPELTKLVEFDSNRPSNKYLESLLKDKQDKPSRVIKKDNTKVVTIDELLDKYNDYKALYDRFGDDMYREGMESVLRKLELASKGIKIMETINED